MLIRVLRGTTAWGNTNLNIPFKNITADIKDYKKERLPKE